MNLFRLLLCVFVLLTGSVMADVTPLTYHAISRFAYDPSGAITFVRRPNDPTCYGISTDGGNDQIGALFRIEENGGVSTLRSFPLNVCGRPTGPVAVDADGNFYGLARGAQQSTAPTDATTLYKIAVDGTLSVLHLLTVLEGNMPVGLLLASDGNFYGVTQRGGISGYGTFFKFTPAGEFTVLYSYVREDGVELGPLIEASDGAFYGVGTGQNGTGNAGMVYQMTKAGVRSVLFTFDGGMGAGSFGGYPIGALVEGADGQLYGTVPYGGPLSYGEIFRVTKAGVGEVFRAFDGTTTGSHVWYRSDNGPLFLASDGNFYGMTNSGGALGYGTLFRLQPNGTLTVLRNLLQSEGATLGLTEGESGAILWSSAGDGPGKIYQLTAGNVFSTVARFTVNPYSSSADGDFASGLVSDRHGNFYGTMMTKGAGSGSVYRVGADGLKKVLHTFSGSDGATPRAALCLASDGNLYGSTVAGGTGNMGTLFRLTPEGEHTVLHSFAGSDGAAPTGRLLEASDGNFYGTTTSGGASGAGTIFRFTSQGQFTILHEFNGPDGRTPTAGLTEGSDGALYGTTTTGGPIRADAYGAGIIFRLTKSGILNLLYSFNPRLGHIDGLAPMGELLQVGRGVFYGTTSGSDGYVEIPFTDSPGTVFRITDKGGYTRVANLKSIASTGITLKCESGLVRGADGALYGTTGNRNPQAATAGLAFQLTLAGALRSLYHFSGAASCTLWREEAGDLWGAVNGANFYQNISGDLGEVFVLSPGNRGAKGNYITLVSDAGSTHAASGRLQLAVGSTRRFTGPLEFAGMAYPLSGQFDPLGDCTLTVPRGLIFSPLTLALHLNVDDAIVNRISGTLSASGNSIAVEMDRAPSFSFGAPASAGRYTIKLAPPAGAGQPGGVGYATLVVGLRGSVTYSGVLPDLTAFSGSSILRNDGTVPIYVGLYAAGARGSLRGELHLREVANISDGDAVLQWDKPPQVSGTYAAGLSKSLTLGASHFVRPPAFTRILGYGDSAPNASLSVNLGILSVLYPFSLLLNNTTAFPPPVLTNPPTPKPTLVIDSRSGTLKGSFSKQGVEHAFSGVVFQKTGTAAGLYRDGNVTLDIGVAAYP